MQLPLTQQQQATPLIPLLLMFAFYPRVIVSGGKPTPFCDLTSVASILSFCCWCFSIEWTKSLIRFDGQELGRGFRFYCLTGRILMCIKSVIYDREIERNSITAKKLAFYNLLSNVCVKLGFQELLLIYNIFIQSVESVQFKTIFQTISINLNFWKQKLK